MSTNAAARPRIFATFPSSRTVSGAYLDAVHEVARWCEDGGCEGALIYTDNSLVDPWVVAQEVIRQTSSLCPLIAVQPVYMHPYAVAKLVASLAHLYRRRVYLNLVAGGFVNDLVALDDHTEHDARYERLVEYATIIKRLIEFDGPVSFDGAWYRTRNLRLEPHVEEELWPGYMLSGSSPAGIAAAESIGATAVQYPRPASTYGTEPGRGTSDRGIRIGLIARADEEEAWQVAWERFPDEPRGRMMHRLAMATSDSHWHGQLSRLGQDAEAGRTPYWLHPFENYKTFCPYLVGSYEAVAGALAEYLDMGIATFILDVPRTPDDLSHASLAFELAGRLVSA